jgi:hypothetical protein
MKKEERREVLIKTLYGLISRNNIEGDLDEVLEYLKGLPEHAKKVYTASYKDVEKATRFKIEESYGYDGFDGYNLLCYRMETDEEMAKRIELRKTLKKEAIEREKNKKIEQEQKERELYETLKKKFEKS